MSNIPTILSLVLFLSGCIGEDRSGCANGEWYVCFESVMSKYDLPDIIDDTTIYLYDHENDLVFSRNYTTEYLVGNDYMASVPLQATGQYTLLASMNSGGDYMRTEARHLPEFNISLLAENGNTVTHKQSDIYHGFSNIHLTGENRDNTRYDPVRLYKNTNHINITLNLSNYAIPANRTLHTSITADNGSYDYRNENKKDDTRTYMAHDCKLIPGGECYNFTVMHVKARGSMSLHIEDRDEKGALVMAMEKDLIREFVKIYPTDEELDQVDVFDLEVELAGNMTIITLIINGWYAIRDGMEV